MFTPLKDAEVIPSSKVTLQSPEGTIAHPFSIFSSFFTGATVGPLLYLQHGHVAMILPCAVLLLLVGQDLMVAKRRMAVSRVPAPAAAPPERETGVARIAR